MSIAVSGLTKKYNGNAVVNGVTLEFRRNEITFVTGTSGVGKSTLLYLIGLLEKESAGSIIYREKTFALFLNGKRPNSGPRPSVSCFRTAICFQGSRLPRTCPISWNCRKRVESDKIDEVLKELGILNLKSRKIETLSGGKAKGGHSGKRSERGRDHIGG